jgi:hypothetical protein
LHCSCRDDEVEEVAEEMNQLEVGVVDRRRFAEPTDVTWGLEGCRLIDVGCDVGMVMNELNLLVVGGRCCKWHLGNEPVGMVVCSWEMGANCNLGKLGMPEEHPADMVKACAGEAIACMDFVAWELESPQDLGLRALSTLGTFPSVEQYVEDLDLLLVVEVLEHQNVVVSSS